MFGKCVLVILAVGTTGCALLALRQSRLQAASEMVRIQLGIREQDEELWLLRTQIAERVTPEQVRQMMSDVGPLRPLRPPGNETVDEPVSVPSGVKPTAPRVPSGAGVERRFATDKDRGKDQR